MRITSCDCCSTSSRRSFVAPSPVGSRAINRSSLINDDVSSRRDPTGTTPLRRRWRNDFRHRFASLKRLMREWLVDRDMLMLRSVTMNNVQVGPTLAQRIEAFAGWFGAVQDSIVFGDNGFWMAAHVRAAYSSGMRQAGRLIRKDPTPDNDRLAAIVAAAVIELDGITDTVEQQASRVVAEGLQAKLSTVQMMHEVFHRITAIGRERTSLMVDAFIIRAHAAGTLDTFQANGVTQVRGVPEFVPVVRDSIILRDARRRRTRRLRGYVEVLTAGDDDVCEICEDLATEVFSIDEAYQILPAHPRCRCKWVPAWDLRFSPTDEGSFLIVDFDPSQERVPAGDPAGGQWVGKNVRAVSLKATKQRAWSGEQVALRNKPSKQQTGEIGESIALAYVQRLLGHKDARVYGLTAGEKATDMIGDHMLIEVKSGLASNGSSAQQWRATEGEPGKAEKEWRKTASREEIAKLGQIRQRRIIERKDKLLKEKSKAIGRKLEGATIATIVNTNTKTVDVYHFKGFHSRIGWKSSEAQKAYKGSFKYG